MSDSNTPNGGIQHTGVGRYTGYTLGNAVVNANISKGAVVQFAAGMSTAAKATSGSGALVAGEWTPQEDLGCGVGQPTAGYTAPFAVVGEGLFDHDLAKLNELEGVTANLRKGGRVPLVKSGLCRALVKASCVAAVTLLEPTSGQFYLTPALPPSVYALLTPSASPGTSAAEDTVGTYTFAANSMKIGQSFRLRGVLTVGANSTPTLNVKVKLGSNILLQSTAITTANGDVAVFDCTLQIRTATTMASGGIIAVGTAAEATNAVEKAGPGVLTSTAVDLTVDNTVTVTVTYGTSHASNIATLQVFTIDKSMPMANQLGPYQNGWAVAMETVDNSAAAALTKVLIFQPAY